MNPLLQPEQKPAPEKPPHPWAKRLGPLAPLAVLLAKGKSLLFALFKLKFLFSFAAFLGIYWALYGAWFGIGFAVMIMIHEMGHFAEVKRRGLPAEMPVFLPGLGAYVKWQALGVSTEARALVSLAGPAAGLLAAVLAAALILADRKTCLGRVGPHRSVAQPAQSDSCVDAGRCRGSPGARQSRTHQSTRLYRAAVLVEWAGDAASARCRFCLAAIPQGDSSGRLGQDTVVFCGTSRRACLVAARHATRKDVGCRSLSRKAKLRGRLG